jgi:hypothetical protein
MTGVVAGYVSIEAAVRDHGEAVKHLGISN